MKQLSAELANHIASEVTTMATCWRVTRTDNVILGFCDLDEDILYQSVLYQSTAGFMLDNISQNAQLESDATQLYGILDSNLIADNDIIAGLYDYAAIEIFQVNYADLTQGKITLRTGLFGEIEIADGGYSVQMYGLMQRLENTIGQLYSPTCRAIFGDNQCQVNLAALTVTGSVASFSDRRMFVDSTRTEENGYFNYGQITFTSGANNGLSIEVKESRGGLLELVLPLPYDIAIGDNFSLVAGCNKSFSTCKGIFNNAINFRGEPSVPGFDDILETSGTFS